MKRRFSDLRVPRRVPTVGEAIAGWLGFTVAILVIVSVGLLLGHFYPPRY